MGKRADGGGSPTSLDLYLRDIGRESLLSRQEEASLARRAREEGDAEALARLVTANLRFVVAVAKRYRGRGVPLEDLIEEGNLGLLRAAERFDEARGVRFVTYAVWWIRQAILAVLEDATPPPAGRSGRPRSGPGRGAPRARAVSLEAPASAGAGLALCEVLADAAAARPDRRMEEDGRRELLERSLAFLPEREEEVLRGYYGLDAPRRSLADLGRGMGVSRERVRQLKDRALARLRAGRHARELRALTEP